MTLTRTHAAVLLATLAGAAAALAVQIPIHALAQTAPAASSIPATAAPAAQIPQPASRPAAPQTARAVIFMDPAHGGSETGAALGNNVAEKDVTLAFTQRLRSALAASGFSIVTTRDSDLTDPLPTDLRAEAANRAHALACIVVHATAGGSGVHLFTSGLSPMPAQDTLGTDSTTPFTPVPWESAQAGFVERSRKLADLLKATLAKSGVSVFGGTAPLRPLDNLMCPAVAVEIAPRDASTTSADATYQQQLASAVANALQLWRDQSATQAGGAQ